MTLEEIADYVPSLPFEELRELETEVMQLVIRYGVHSKDDKIFYDLQNT